MQSHPSSRRELFELIAGRKLTEQHEARMQAAVAFANAGDTASAEAIVGRGNIRIVNGEVALTTEGIAAAVEVEPYVVRRWMLVMQQHGQRFVDATTGAALPLRFKIKERAHVWRQLQLALNCQLVDMRGVSIPGVTLDTLDAPHLVHCIVEGDDVVGIEPTSMAKAVAAAHGTPVATATQWLIQSAERYGITLAPTGARLASGDDQ